MKKKKTKQISLEKFGLKVKKQPGLEKFGLKILPATRVSKKLYEQVKEAEEKRLKAKDLYKAIKADRHVKQLLGEGREFRVYDFRGIKYGVVLKKQRPELMERRTFKEAVESAKEHIKAHKAWGWTGIRVPKRLATQMQIVKIRPVHVVEKVVPLAIFKYKKYGKKLEVKSF